MIDSVTIPACECGGTTWTLTDDTANATGTDPFYWKLWLLTCNDCGHQERLGLTVTLPEIPPLTVDVFRAS